MSETFIPGYSALKCAALDIAYEFWPLKKNATWILFSDWCGWICFGTSFLSYFDMSHECDRLCI